MNLIRIPTPAAGCETYLNPEHVVYFQIEKYMAEDGRQLRRVIVELSNGHTMIAADDLSSTVETARIIKEYFGVEVHVS